MFRLPLDLGTMAQQGSFGTSKNWAYLFLKSLPLDLDIFPGRSYIRGQLSKAFRKYDFKQSELEKGQNSLRLMKLDSYNEKFDHEVITDLRYVA